jgi:hypothetical protein
MIKTEITTESVYICNMSNDAGNKIIIAAALYSDENSILTFKLVDSHGMKFFVDLSLEPGDSGIIANELRMLVNYLCKKAD